MSNKTVYTIISKLLKSMEWSVFYCVSSVDETAELTFKCS